MKSIKATLDSGGLSLEACLVLPAATGRCPGVVLCHPHPLYGGNMDNNVIGSVSRALAGSGLAALCFNFRGVGLSPGSFDNGRGEQEDAVSALSFLAMRDELDSERLGVMGYSFGGMVALAVGRRDGSVKAVAAVSPVITPGALREYSRPAYIVTGSDDSIIPASGILKETANMACPNKVEVVPGADHFWWGREDMVAERVAAFFAESLMARKRQD